MNRILLLILMAVASGSAIALSPVVIPIPVYGVQWIKVSSDENIAVYAEPPNLRIRGDNNVIMWHIVDRKTGKIIAGKTSMSEKVRYEYDCKNKRVRMLYLQSMSENMGKGEPAGMDNNITEWNQISLSSTVEALWRTACKGE